ncbi:MAG TPA: hypothetical protein HA355_03525 [Methanosphaera sp.]|nr:hypothetical protein [Methanosphaera sp.]
MLMLKEFKIERGLVDSDGEPIDSKEMKTYYVLYESEKIKEFYISTLFINTLNGYYDEAYFTYKDYFIILTKAQYDNLFKGKIKNA